MGSPYDSSYYLGIMNSCVKQARGLNGKISSYKSYSETLKSVSENINLVSGYLNLCNQNFAAGGCVTSEGSIFNTELKSYKQKADNIKLDLDTLYTNTNNKINEFKQEFASQERKYNSAKQSFYSCEIRFGNPPVFPTMCENFDFLGAFDVLPSEVLSFSQKSN